MSDKKNFFISKKDLPRLKEFINTFKPKVFIVETKQENIIEIENIAKKVCCQENNSKKLEYNVIEELKIKENKTKRPAEDIKNFIEKEINNKKPISVKKIKEKYKKISESTLYSQIRTIKKELEKNGFMLTKNKDGFYEKKRIRKK